MSNKNVKKGLPKSIVIITLAFQFLITTFISLVLVLYTPLFSTLRKYLVSSLMETQSHQYIAKLFLSDEQIAAILGDNSHEAVEQQISSVRATNTSSTDVHIYSVSGAQYSGYVIEVSNPLRVKVGMTSKVGVVGERTSVIAERAGALAAINGGGFQGGVNWSDSAKYPTNFVFHEGNVIWKDKNWSDSKKVNVIAIDNNGVLVVGDHSIDELKKLNVQEAVTMPKNSQNDFKPFIVNGKRQFKKGSTESRAPRTAIAQLKDGTILLVVLDGRKVGQLGATYYELQELLLNKFGSSDNPVETAAILDGGGSSTMYYNGEVINNPSAAFGERTVATAFYVEQ